MSWIDYVIIFIVFGGLVAIIVRASKTQAVRSGLHILAGVARVECRDPRLTPGVAKIMPAVAREPLEKLYCTRWKFHDGEHESPIDYGPDHKPGIERWSS